MEKLRFTEKGRKLLYERIKHDRPELMEVVEHWVNAGYLPARIESLVTSLKPVDKNLPVYLAEVARYLIKSQLPPN